MKKLVSSLLVLALVFGLTGCTPTDNKANQKVSGVYSGASAGMQGNLSVDVTLEEGVIKDVKITETSETESIAAVALERIPAKMVENQTTDVDVVTGATLTSYAIMRAASNALKEAGVDLSETPFREAATADEEMEADVIVVGGGGAGISAAISAAQEGSSVILIEKSSFLGGNTMMAGGAFNAVDEKAQAETILSVAQKTTMDSYLALSVSDESLHFDLFPEWESVLTDLQSSIKQFYNTNKGKTAGVDMPGYDSVELHMWQIYTGGLREMNDGTWTVSNVDLARTLAENALDSYDWLGTLGAGTTSKEGAGESLYTVLGAMWPRTHSYKPGAALIEVLKTAAEKEGVKIYTETGGKSLIVDDSGKVVGVEAEKANGTKVVLKAKNGVVLATGGYCANPQMVKEYDQYWGDDLTATTLTTNVGTNKGDGILMAQEVGSATTDLGVAQLMPSSSPRKGTMTDGIWGDASQQIWIDASAKRFVNEYAERDVLARASLKLDNGIFYIIYAGPVGDSGFAEGANLESSLFGTSVQSMVDNGHVWYGSTLAELAEASSTMAGGATPSFKEEDLRAVIELYNSYVETQDDVDFGKEVLSGAIDLEKIEADPNMGIIISPRKASLHHTMGGVTINTNAEVVDTDGNAIAGLWAAGEVTGGVHGGNRLGGNAITDIFTYGRIAGRNAGSSK